MSNKWLHDEDKQLEVEAQEYMEDEDDRYAEGKREKDVVVEEGGDDDDEGLEIISQRQLLAPEADSSSSSRQNIYERRAESLSTTHQNTHTQHVPNELRNGWKTRGVVRRDNATPMEAGKWDTWKATEAERRKLTSGTVDLKKGATDYPTISRPSSNPDIVGPSTLSYRLQIYTHHNFLRVGDVCRILNTAKYPTYSAISAAILSGLQRGTSVNTEPCNWKIAGLTVVGRLSGSTGKEKFVVRDEEDWQTVTENVL